jgi:NTP pyrophosphatase (non-canonical NTP hydrolase)
MILLGTFQREVDEWAKRTFGSRAGTGYKPLLGVAEEVGELCHAHLKGKEEGVCVEENRALARDAIGDIVIFLAHYCAENGYDLECCIQDTWDEVQKRTWARYEEMNKNERPASGKVSMVPQRFFE